jgi:fluoride exporter
MNALLVILGAGLGGGARHGVNLAVARLAPGLGFPVATLVINVLGSVLMGVLAEAFLIRGGESQSVRLFLTTGVLGGFTTFSTFSLDAVALYQRGEGTAAALYVLASVGLGIAGLVAGIALARAVAG